MLVLSVAAPASPSELGRYDTVGLVFDVVAAPGYAYLADYSSGLQLVNMANPSLPVFSGRSEAQKQAAARRQGKRNLCLLADLGGIGLDCARVQVPLLDPLRPCFDDSLRFGLDARVHQQQQFAELPYA